MTTYKLTISYLGSPFHGFARQPDTLTVQGELERALSTVLREKIETVCAGRTDTGVHARRQVVSFESRAHALGIERSLNALTHDGISVKEIEVAKSNFSARFDAKWREYRYFICNSQTPPIFSSQFSWHVKKPLDTGKIKEACPYLIGEHDFKSFCLAASAQDKNTVREIFSIDVFTEHIFGEELLCVRVVGNAFLHSMIRAIVGTLCDIGKGNKCPEDFKAILEAKNRSAAGENAPPQGLVFWHVEY